MGDYHFHFAPLWQALPEIWEATGTAVLVAAASIVLAFVIGTSAALASEYGGRRARIAVAVYVEAMRNSPSLVKIFFIYYGLPSLGLYPSPFWSGVAALALHNGGYVTEIVRGGLAAVNRTQVQAAMSLGFGWFETQRTVVLPQALRQAIPALGNVWVEMVKDTSLTSAIAVRELFYLMTALVSATLRSFEILAVFAAIYFALTTLVAVAMKVGELRTEGR
ncbi:MAG: amino acid ABC transporter permease [Alphaproteobacteria bacterium]|nr:amino acid ABC transporter permease [Alphaproteobacteria bacterium]